MMMKTTVRSVLDGSDKNNKQNSHGFSGFGRQPKRGASLWKPGGQKQIARPLLLTVVLVEMLVVFLVVLLDVDNFTWQEHSLPTDHRELVCRDGGMGHTCSSSKAGLKFIKKLLLKTRTPLM